MDTLVFFSLLLVLILLLSKKMLLKNGGNSLPPGPPGWPIFGNIFDLGTIPHQTFYKFRFIYGPVTWLKLGSINTMVIQSASVATEFFKNHDLSFCDKKTKVAIESHNFNKGAVSLVNHGPYWRVMRRLYAVEFMDNKRLNQTAIVRQKCVDDMIRSIEEDAQASRMRGESGEVSVPHVLLNMGFNIVGNIVLSRDLSDYKSEKKHDFFEAMDKVMELVGTPNLADYLPFLKWLDPHGIQKNGVREIGRTMKIAEEFVKERIEEHKHRTTKVNRDFLDALIAYEGDDKDGPNKITEHNLTIIVMEAFFAGTETTSSTLEWAMAELLNNPECMRKGVEELEQVVGRHRKVEESDIDDLTYLQAILKETLRLHPPVPLLGPRNSTEDNNFMGYSIPKDTQVFVNVWANGRDPDAWKDPLCFKPERFLSSNVNYKGRFFEFIPFGSGRRICAGVSLAHRVINLALASLIHRFDWESLGSVDMNESVGVTLGRLVPLKAIPTKRVN